MKIIQKSVFDYKHKRTKFVIKTTFKFIIIINAVLFVMPIIMFHSYVFVKHLSLYILLQFYSADNIVIIFQSFLLFLIYMIL